MNANDVNNRRKTFSSLETIRKEILGISKDDKDIDFLNSTFQLDGAYYHLHFYYQMNHLRTIIRFHFIEFQTLSESFLILDMNIR